MSSYAEKEHQRKEDHQRYMDRTEALSKVICPLRTAAYEVDYEWRNIERMLEDFASDYGGLELDPPFQRGHVWTPEQQRHYIENALRGVISTSGFLVQFNCPNWNNHQYKGDLPLGMQCIDGLQRITAVRQFMKGEVRPFGFTPDDLKFSRFSVVSNYSFRIAVHDFQRQADLLQHYVDLNAGGTPHSPEEIERVRRMLSEVTTK